jgi:hypothetical protein
VRKKISFYCRLLASTVTVLAVDFYRMKKKKPFSPRHEIFWYRYNPSETFPAELHTENCPYCERGQYRRVSWRMGQTMVWIGPFDLVHFVWRRWLYGEGDRRYKQADEPALKFPIPILCDCILTSKKIHKFEKEYLNQRYPDSPPFLMEKKVGNGE